jgi:hypothetical protein
MVHPELGLARPGWQYLSHLLLLFLVFLTLVFPVLLLNPVLYFLILLPDSILSFFWGFSGVKNPFGYFHQILDSHFPKSFLLI